MHWIALICQVTPTKTLDPSADVSPMMALLLLGVIGLILLGIGLAVLVALLLSALLLMLISCGMITTAMLAGLYRRRFSTVLRVLHAQGCVLFCAAVALIALIFLRFGGLHEWTHGQMAWISAASGLLAGAASYWLQQRILRHLARRFFGVPLTDATTR